MEKAKQTGSADVGLSALEAIVLSQAYYFSEQPTTFAKCMADYILEERDVFQYERDFRGLSLGKVTEYQVDTACKTIFDRGLIRFITADIAESIVQERTSALEFADLEMDDLIGQRMLTNSGAAVLAQVFDAISWLEEDSTRWFIRGVSEFSLWGCCTAMRDNPGSYRCCQLGCRVEVIGPWAIPYNIAVESGWRLICNRRADGC